MKLEALRALLAVLRANRVTVYRDADLTLTLAAEGQPAAAPEAPAPQAPPLAPCGHEWHEQSDAGCLHGCVVPEVGHEG